MKKIIVFFNSEPAVVVPAMTGVNTIMREYPNGEKTHLTVMAAGFPSLTGDHKVIYVAADRHVTSEEILEAAGFAPIFPDTCYHLTHYWL
ncbi:hypothetical protein SG163_18850, partial [Escherichia coli]|uniref:hypothetical protein n=1 Tax=Escherichia coli TaxID=562 RepID=UPI0029C373B3